MPILTSTQDGGAAWNTVSPRSLSGWIARVVPADVPLLVDHEGEPVGRWIAFSIDTINDAEFLTGEGLLDEGRRGEELLHLLDTDPRAGFSAATGTTDWSEHERVVGGPPLVVYHSRVEVTEISIASPPADDACQVLKIFGREPVWRSRQRSAEFLAELALRGVRL